MTPDMERRLRNGDIDPLAYERERRSARKSYLITHGFELSIAIAGLAIALQFITDSSVRQAAAIGSLGRTFAWEWTILFLIGSIGIIAGMIKPEDRWEIAGLSCFSAACIAQTASLFQVRGSHGVYVALIFFAFVGGSASRIYLLLALRRMPPAPTPPASSPKE